MLYSGQPVHISPAQSLLGQNVAQLQRAGVPISVVRVQACGVSSELLAQLGQDEGAWVEYQMLAVTANHTFDHKQSTVVFAGSVVTMEQLPAKMKKAALVLEICQNVQPMADVIKVMLLVEPVDVPHGVYMWRQDVLYSKSHLYEAIAKDPRDGAMESELPELPELGDDFWGSGPDVIPGWVKEVQSFQLGAKRGAAYWQEQADRPGNAPHVLWQKIFAAMEKMWMSKDATALEVWQASMKIFLQLTELELANYLCIHFQRLCVTPRAPNTVSSTTPVDAHADDGPETVAKSGSSTAGDEEATESSSCSSECEPFTDAQVDEQLEAVMKARAQNQITVVQAFNGMQM